jgi:hypothetical protein
LEECPQDKSILRLDQKKIAIVEPRVYFRDFEKELHKEIIARYILK